MQTSFLPFIQFPVTEHTTVYNAMKSFIKVFQQLDQKTLVIFRKSFEMGPILGR